MNDTAPNVRELPLRVRAELAAKQAGLEVIAEHKRTGEPLVIWRDGTVVHIPAEEYEKEIARSLVEAAESNGAKLPAGVNGAIIQ